MAAFDERFFRRFYENRASRVQGRREVNRLASVVTTIVETSYGPIRTALDIGAGTGLWRDWFAARRPRTRYRSTDVSAYACQRYGHERRDIARWRVEEEFDLVVCQSVLPYLSDADAARAIRNITAMTRGFLYLEAVTDRDLAVADCATDFDMKGRPAEWYRSRLRKGFQQVGYGLWVRRTANAHLWELEYGAD